MGEHRARKRLGAALAAVVLAASVLLATVPNAASDTAPANPADPRTPVTASADALPTAQINGVAWQQAIVGDTVYVVGRFTTARPAGAAAGTQTVTRNNILAYNLATGALISSFAPSLNAQALSIAAAPDGSRIYIGGDFTSVNGTQVWRVAALDPATGAVIAGFRPRMASQVRAIAATANAVYMGGTFTTVGSASRLRLAAARPSDGALLAWNPAANSRVNALALSPDASQVAIGGAFTTLNGSDRPGYGLGRVDASTGASLPFNANNTVRNAGNDSAILSLSSDGTNVYGTGYIYGTGGNLEGAFSANWSDGEIRWVEDCHGDTYGVWASASAVYTVGHAHYCGNFGGFPETTPRSYHRALAFGTAATGTMTRDIYGYPSFTGVAAPSLLTWFPDLDTGTATGQNQGPWAVAGTAQYVALAGEFRTVNGTAQQGLVRFAVSTLAPNREAPRVGGANFRPTAAYVSPGTVRVRWQANWDRDNALLTYHVIRDGNTASPAETVTVESTFWQRPTLEFVDTGLTVGTHTYRIFARDPFGNETRGDTVSVSVEVGAPGGSAPSATFTTSVSGSTVSVDGSGSSDPDGSIVAYAWEFGNGATGSGATATHTYAAPGTYTVTLRVTDDDGATATTSRTVTVQPAGPAGTLASDTFTRTVSSGWGTAETGGDWTRSGAAHLFAVTDGAGTATLAAAGSSAGQFLPSVSSTATDVAVAVALDKPATGGGTYLYLSGRRIDEANQYRAKVKIASNGAVTLYATRVLGGTETTLSSTVVAGLTLAAGEQLLIRHQAVGEGSTTVRARVWKSGTPEPGTWQVSATDSTGALQGPGGIAVRAYLSGSTTNAPVRASFDGLDATAVEP